jgi:hypothetical protein
MKKLMDVLSDFFLPTFWRAPEKEGVVKNFRAAVGNVFQRFPLAVALLSAVLGAFAESLAGGDPQRSVSGFIALTAFWAVACVFLSESKALSKNENIIVSLCGIAVIWASFCNAESSGPAMFVAVLLVLTAAFLLGPVRFEAKRRVIVDVARVVFIGAGAVLSYLFFLWGADKLLHAMPADNIAIREKTLTLFLLPVFWFTCVMLLASLPGAMPGEGKTKEKENNKSLRRKAGVALSIFAGILFFSRLLSFLRNRPGRMPPKTRSRAGTTDSFIITAICNALFPWRGTTFSFRACAAICCRYRRRTGKRR